MSEQISPTGQDNPTVTEMSDNELVEALQKLKDLEITKQRAIASLKTKIAEIEKRIEPEIAELRKLKSQLEELEGQSHTKTRGRPYNLISYSGHFYLDGVEMPANAILKEFKIVPPGSFNARPRLLQILKGANGITINNFPVPPEVCEQIRKRVTFKE